MLPVESHKCSVSLWSVNTRLDMNDMGVRIVQSLFLKCTPKSPQCPECWVFSVFPVLVPVPSCVRQQRLGMNEVSGAFRDWAVLRTADMLPMCDNVLNGEYKIYLKKHNLHGEAHNFAYQVSKVLYNNHSAKIFTEKPPNFKWPQLV